MRGPGHQAEPVQQIRNPLDDAPHPDPAVLQGVRRNPGLAFHGQGHRAGVDASRGHAKNPEKQQESATGRLNTAFSAGLLASVVLSGCGSTQQATDAARSQWIGRSADEFFAKNGPPRRQYNGASGKVYGWETVAMPSGTMTQIVCSADIVTDARGTISEIRLLEDSIGHWNTSRCTEVFR